MPNPTKPTINLTREELRQAIRKDFHELLVKEFTADWKIQRLLHDLELDVMDFGNTMQLFDTYTQAKEREARMDQLDKLIDIESKTFNQWTQTDIANFFHEVGRQYRDLEAENENL
jgi:hypothetical protein